MKIDIHMLIGNHDIYFKNTNKVNTTTTMYSSSSGVNEDLDIRRTKVVDFDGLKILMFVWIKY